MSTSGSVIRGAKNFEIQNGNPLEPGFGVASYFASQRRPTVLTKPQRHDVATDGLVFDREGNDYGGNDAGNRLNQYNLRSFHPDDINVMVEVDIDSFRSVYLKVYGDLETARSETAKVFHDRYTTLNPYWTDVLTVGNDRVVGFLTAFPTSKSPDSFVSWEDTTDGGTLSGAYDENGKFLYVVTLSTLSEAASDRAHYMLLTSMMAKMYQSGLSSAYFLPRIPGMRRFVRNYCRENELNPDEISQDVLMQLAGEYVSTTVRRNNSEVKADPLLRILQGIGCDFERVVENGYDDPDSYNFGVLTTWHPALPRTLRGTGRLGNKVYGKVVANYSHSLPKSTKYCEVTALANKERADSKGRDNVNVRRNRIRLAAGLVGLQAAGVTVAGQTTEFMDSAISQDSGKLILNAGLLEVMWIGGLATMCASAGLKMNNISKVLGIRKSGVKELQASQNYGAELRNNKLYIGGFVVWTAAALAQSAVLTEYVVTELPSSSWVAPSLFIGLDLWLTFAIRKMIFNSTLKTSR